MEMIPQLSLEQQFKLQLFGQQVKQLSQQEAQEFVLELLRQAMVKDNIVKQILKNA